MDLSDGSDVEGDVEEVDENALLGSDDEEQYANNEQHISEEYFEEHEGEEHNLDGDVLDLELHDDDGLGFGDDTEGSARKIAPVQVRTSAISSQQSNDNDAVPNTASYQHQIPEHYEHNEGYGEDEELDYGEDEDDDDDVDDSKNTRTRFQNERNAEQISGQNVTCFGKPIQIVGAIKTTEDGNRQRHNWNQRNPNHGLGPRQRFPMPRNHLLLMRPRQHFNQFNRLPRGGPRMNFCPPLMQFQNRMYTNFDQFPRPPNPHPIREPGVPPIFQGPPQPPGMMGPGPEATVGPPPSAQPPNQNPNFNNQMIQNNPRLNMRPQMRVPHMGHPRQQWRGPRPRGIHPQQQFSRVPPMNQVMPQHNMQPQNNMQFMNPGPPQMYPQDPNYSHSPPQMYQEQQQMPYNPPYSMGPIPHGTFQQQQQPHIPGPPTDMPPQNLAPQAQPNFFPVHQQPQMQNIQIHQNPNFVPHQQQQLQQQPQQLVGGWQNVNHDQQQQLNQNSSWYPPPGNPQNFMQPNVDLNLMHGSHINANFQPPPQQQQQSQLNPLPIPNVSVSSESHYKRNISNIEYASRSRRDDDYLNHDKRSSRERRRSSSSERDHHDVSRRNRDRDYDYEEREYSIRKRKYHESSTEKRFDGRLGPPITNSPKAASKSPVKIDEKAEELLKIREESKKTVGLDDEYIKKIEQQKKLREEILRRKAAARKKLNGPDFCEPDDSCETQQETATKQSIYINPKTFKGNLSSLTKLKSNEVAKSTITRTFKSDPVGTTISNKPRKVLKIVKDKYGNIISKSKVIYVPKQQPQDGRTSSA